MDDSIKAPGAIDSGDPHQGHDHLGSGSPADSHATAWKSLFVLLKIFQAIFTDPVHPHLNIFNQPGKRALHVLQIHIQALGI